MTNRTDMPRQLDQTAITTSLSIGRTHFTEDELQPNQKEAVAAIKTILDQLRRGADAYISDAPRYTVSTISSVAPWYNRTDRPTQVISIFGERGQGKTATLYS